MYKFYIPLITGDIFEIQITEHTQINNLQVKVIYMGKNLYGKQPDTVGDIGVNLI